MTSSTPPSAALAEFWSDDFRPLQFAGQAVLRALRDDESASNADLFRQVTDNLGKHLYFPSSDETIQHLRTDPLPPVIASALRNDVKMHTFMGILAPASLVWVTVDDKLYLWPFLTGGACFSCKANQPIITVGLIKPKKGMYSAKVKWLLAVTTPDEVLLFVLHQESDLDPTLKIRATPFILSTDNVRMLSVVGTNNGRIFLGGEDGCLYEMTYQAPVDQPHRTEEEILNEFYDQGKEMDEIIYIDGASSSMVENLVSLGKRSLGWDGSKYTESGRPKKCRKLNRTSSVSSWVSAVVPDLLLKAAGLLFGGKTSTGGGPITKMVVDDDRRTIYTLSQMGWICSFSLQENVVQLAAVMETPRTVQLYLEAVARGQVNPPNGGSSGHISFNGSGLAAQAGVGGMEGARGILKNADLRMKRTNGRGPKYDSSLVPVSIHVIPTAESQRLTLLAVTGSGLRLYLSSLSSTSGLGPSSRLTLYHIRAPPPIDPGQERFSAVDDSGIVGGMKPNVPGRDKTTRVDAAFYKEGVFFAAMECNRLPEDDRSYCAGDTMVATYPDSSLRKIERMDRNTDDKKEALVAPGGLVESAIMLGSSLGAVSILSGGVVIDMAQIAPTESAAMTLARNSLTPTDNELSIGVPAEYFPPSKLQSRTTFRAGSLNGEKRIATIVVRHPTLAGGVVGLVGKVLSNTVFGQTLRRGVPQSSGGFFGEKRAEQLYRVSKRDGASGYSLTAAEKGRYGSKTKSTSTMNQRTSTTSKSVRLRKWLLKPPPVPLNQLATQHLATPKKVVALNAGGVHLFGVNPVLESLAEALRSAGENVASDPNITNFFARYTYKEGCAMCLALAVGCGPAKGQSVSDQRLQELASAAAFAHSFVPKLILKSDESTKTDAVFHTASTTIDPLVPPGYEFHPSELCKGLTVLISRLLRPAWFKPVVVVTEGRVLKSSFSARTRTTPAKVEILISEEKLGQIQMPLVNLLRLMKKFFARAVTVVPGMPQNQAYVMEIDDDITGDAYVTRALHYQNQLHSGMNGLSNIMKPAEAERLARLIEERNIHSLYRLCSRVVQVLNLMSLLYKAQSAVELNEIEWGLLHGLTIAQLVETRDGQDRLERLLNSLVTVSAAEGVGRFTMSAHVDQLANLFSEQCYSFFSSGSRSAYFGFMRANEALETPEGSDRRLSLTNQAGNHFRDAAKHWYSAPIITGRILHSKGRETFKDIALRAFDYQSPLAKAADVLIRLGEVVSAVDICLLTSNNFRAAASSTNSSTMMDPRVTHSGLAFPWEQHLYRKRLTETSGSISRNGPGSPPSPSHIVAGGVAVTAKDAIDTCYALIFYFFSRLIASEQTQRQAYSMVSACAASGSREFLHTFFSFLLENRYTDTLLMIDSPVVEEWLRDRKDPELLWSYYMRNQRAFDAGEVCFTRAMDTVITLSLEERIEYLSRAVTSFNSNLEQARNDAYGSIDEATQNKLTVFRERLNLARDSLRIALIQKRILSAVDSRRRSDKTFVIANESYDRLAGQIIEASELFNRYTGPLFLFDHCLLILHACKFDDPRVIHRVWLSVIADEILPCETRDMTVLENLRTFVDEVELAGDVLFLGPDDTAQTLTLFENGDWKGRVETHIVDLGRELYGTGADFCFPVDYLLSRLEALREIASDKVEMSWALFVLARSGVRYLELLDSYDSLCRQASWQLTGGGDQNKRMEEVHNIVRLIELWVETARGGVIGAQNLAHTELSQAIASGQLLPRIERLRATIQSLPDTTFMERVDSIEDAIKLFNNGA